MKSAPANYKELSYKDLSSEQKKLLAAAEEAMHTSYSPYSHFYVGAAVLNGDGRIAAAANVENAAWASICAERSAIVKANSELMRDIKAIALIGRGKNSESEDVIAPCGVCRQVIYESAQLAGKDIDVIMSNSQKTKIIIASIHELLPLAFGPKDLRVDLSEYTTKHAH
jgi:cytidine deaminase